MNDLKPGSTLIDASTNNQPLNFKRRISRAVKTLSILEKTAFSLALIIALFTGYKLLNIAYNSFSIEIPAQGGTVHEAATDFSRFINPVLGRGDVDKDLITLIFSGLVKPDETNNLVNDLAESVTKSDDGLTYTATLKQGATFHDNTPITADDVVFTVQKIQDPAIKSPLSGNWVGVVVRKVDDRTVTFTLPQSYEPFIQNLTLGILPSHLWANTTADAFDINPLNRKPIGSGPYRVASSKESAPGVVSQYVLEPFANYSSEKPFIGQYIFDMYKDEESAIKAVLSGSADIVSGLSIDTFSTNKAALLKKAQIYTPALPRLFGLFFNQNSSPVLLNAEVRKALEQSIDRNDLINTVRDGYGTPTDSPIPGILLSTNTEASSSDEVKVNKSDLVALAQETLTAKGWKKDAGGVFQKQVTNSKKQVSTTRLSLTISTSNSPELKAIAQYVADVWKNVGAEVSVQIYESADLADKVVRPRKYDILLFGQVVGRDWDLYPFWHSSQQKDTGLNLSMYANKKVDAALDKLRSNSSEDDKQKAVETIISEIKNDRPAIFLYSPEYILLMSHSVKGVNLESIDSGNERLYRISKWYTNTKRILQSAFNKN